MNLGDVLHWWLVVAFLLIVALYIWSVVNDGKKN